MPTLPTTSSATQFDSDALLEWLAQLLVSIRDLALHLVKSLGPGLKVVGSKILEAFCAYASVDAWILAHLPTTVSHLLELSDQYARTKPVDFVLLCVLLPFVTVVSLFAAVLALICVMMLAYVTLLVCIGFGRLGPRGGSIASASQSRYYGSTGVPARSTFASAQSRGMRGPSIDMSVIGGAMPMLFKWVAIGAAFILLRGAYVMLDACLCH